MKKLWYIIRNIFLGIWVGLMLLFYTIWTALCYPVRYLRYRRTAFYQETGIPFGAAADSSDFRLYEQIREAGLPIRYLPSMDPRRMNGWFFHGNTLILHMFDELSYSDKLQSWTLFPDDALPLEDTVARQLQLIRQIEPEIRIDSVRILIDRMEVDPKDLPLAKQLPMFLIYDSEPVEALRELCTKA
ncbi:MAG: hypothetical protein IJE58_09250 [Oscillospiraceae bacterium]|nr:hypothetical protein [Oscillospiraceae bacterium]